MLRVKYPQPKDQFPDPEEFPTPEDLAEWESNPVSHLLVQRLRRAAAKASQFSSESEYEFLSEALKSEGLRKALEVIETALKNVRNRETQEE